MAKSTNQIIRKCYTTVAEKPKNIDQIAKEINTSWESARRGLRLLKSLGLVKEHKKENKRIFSLIDVDYHNKKITIPTLKHDLTLLKEDIAHIHHRLDLIQQHMTNLNKPHKHHHKQSTQK